MARFNFCAGTYTSESPNVDAQRCMNFYPERVESGDGTTPIALYPTPGTRLFTNLNTSFVRAVGAPVVGTVYAIAGLDAYQVIIANGQWVATNHLGTMVATSIFMPNSPGSIAGNDVGQILFCASGSLYLYDPALITFTQVALTVTALSGFSRCFYMDGYFVAQAAGTSRFYISAPEDGHTWNPLDFADVSEFPGNIVDICPLQRQIWCFGPQQSVPYYNSGAPNFPFDPVQGAFVEHGAIGQGPNGLNGFSATVADNSILWLGSDIRGSMMAWRMDGYTPKRISNHAVEAAWQKFGWVDPAQTFAYAYQENGHIFWVIQFRVASGPPVSLGVPVQTWVTWVYDCSTLQWHERSSFNNGVEGPATGLCHCAVDNIHIIGGSDGNLYTQSVSYLTDNDKAIRRYRRSPHVGEEKQWVHHQQVQVDLETGTGTMGSASPAITIYLEDAASIVWAVTIDDAGVLHSAVLAGTPEVIVFQDSVTPTLFYQWVINTAGVWSFVAVQPLTNYVQSFQMQSPSSQAWNITIAASVATIAALAPIPPQINLRWSDDSARTWSNYYPISAGALGEYKTRCIWRRLGRSRDRVYEISVSDPSPWRIVDSYLQVAGGQ